MNTRNKPASLTSSLLARKGEAEPAAEPNMILESGSDHAKKAVDENAAGSSDRTADGEVGFQTGSTGTAASGESGSSTGQDPDADASGATPAGFEEDRETVRDRRLLRFVYATAVLTGVLAVVIYAGDWFFSDDTVRSEGRSRVVIMKPAPERSESVELEAPQPEPMARPQPLAPPGPPAPPAVEEAEPPRMEDQPASAAKDDVKPDAAVTVEAAETKAEAAELKESAEIKVESAPKAVAPPSSANPVAIPKAPPPSTEKSTEKTAVATRATGTPAPTADGRYYVQLASVPKEAAAKQLWLKLQRDFPDILGEYDLTLQERVIANKGTFFRVQVGRFATFKDVRGLCDLLKARKQACLPVKR